MRRESKSYDPRPGLAGGGSVVFQVKNVSHMVLFDAVKVMAFQNLALNTYAKFSYKFVVVKKIAKLFHGCVLYAFCIVKSM